MTDDTLTPGPVTRLLIDWSEGNAGARDEMLPLVYDELRRLAALYLLHERATTRCNRLHLSTRHTFGSWISGG